MIPIGKRRLVGQWTLPLDSQGKLHLSYKEGFLKIPGFKVEDRDNPKEPIYFSDENIRGLTMTGKPNHIVVMECSGLIARKL